MFLLLFIQVTCQQTMEQFLKLSTTEFKQLKEQDIVNYFSQANMNGYLTTNDITNLTNKLQLQYTQYVQTTRIGQTFQGRPINTFRFKMIDSPKRRIVIVGMLHGDKDMSSAIYLMEQIYLIVLKLVQNDQYIQRILAERDICIIPILNLDTYYFIEEKYQKTQTIVQVDKNRNNLKGCDELTLGVDLQRNYLHKFGVDDVGSSSLPCNAFYRGSSPFSEPESKAVDYLVQQIRPDMILVFGGEIPGIISYDQTMDRLFNKLGEQYKMKIDTYLNTFGQPINGGLCNHYLYAINAYCYGIYLGNQNIKTMLNNYNQFLLKLLKQYNSSLNLQLVNQLNCQYQQSICSQLQSDASGYIVALTINNTGFYDFYDNIDLSITIEQNGEFLYKMSQYGIGLNYSDINNMSIYNTVGIKVNNQLTYAIRQKQYITSGQGIQIVFLLKSSKSDNYISTVKNISVIIELTNALEDGIIEIPILTDEFQPLIKYIDNQSLFPNRGESYVILICFGAISVIFLIVWILRKIYLLIYPQKSMEQHNHIYDNGLQKQSQQDEKHQDIRITQVAPSNRLNDSPGTNLIPS